MGQVSEEGGGAVMCSSGLQQKPRAKAEGGGAPHWAHSTVFLLKEEDEAMDMYILVSTGFTYVKC